MLDYYVYLWKATWPEVIATTCVTIFILGRLIWRIGNDLRYYKRWGRLLIILRGGFWLAILGSYLLMFSLANPDWFVRPGEVQGEIQGKALTDSQSNPYSIQVKVGTDTVTLWVDYRTYKTLQLGDRVKIKDLPNRLEVYRCEVLP